LHKHILGITLLHSSFPLPFVHILLFLLILTVFLSKIFPLFSRIQEN